VELEDTPFFPQEAYQCGPAALAILLNHHRVAVTPEQLTPQVYLPERQGSLQVEMTATARRYGMLAYSLTPQLNELFSEVAAGHPVLVLQNLGLDWLPRWHYAVVVGYDLAQRQVILRSGRHRRWVSGLSAFQNTWDRAANWALVILPPEQIPRTAQSADYLQAAFQLEQTGQADAALQAYRAASERWPQQKSVWLALANHAYALQQYRTAHNALRRAAALAPDDPIVWNNLAYIYLAAGCSAQAQQAIAQALQLSPQDANLLDTRAEIAEKTRKGESRACAFE
jgi:tetratricopeptide (TPR) repeat protein